MSQLSSLIRLMHPATFATTLAIAAMVAAPSRTLAQATPTPGNATPQTGCLAGNPDGTYQGDRPVTRYEFAAGINACLDRVNPLLPANRANLATKADFEVLIQRQRELNAQLRELSRRVDSAPITQPSPSPVR